MKLRRPSPWAMLGGVTLSVAILAILAVVFFGPRKAPDVTYHNVVCVPVDSSEADGAPGIPHTPGPTIGTFPADTAQPGASIPIHRRYWLPSQREKAETPADADSAFWQDDEAGFDWGDITTVRIYPSKEESP